MDWANAGSYIWGMEAFLHDKVQAMIDKGCWMQAFELTNQVFITIGNQDMDDSDGGTGMLAEVCYEYWKQILENAAARIRIRYVTGLRDIRRTALQLIIWRNISASSL